MTDKMKSVTQRTRRKFLVSDYCDEFVILVLSVSCLQGERIVLSGGAFALWCLIIRLLGEGRAHVPLPPNSLRLILKVTNSQVAHCIFFSLIFASDMFL